MVAATVPLVGETVLLKGWVQTRRDMGKIAFVDLRDRSGMVQVVLVPSEIGEAGKELMKELRTEYCISVTGVVQARSEKQINTEIETGTVEILAKELEILNPSKTPPFELDETSGVNEEVRLKYRYLDLRSVRMLKNLMLRDAVVDFLRDFLHEEDFIEVETPCLTKGTPEGSREFLVPSRIHPGEFYVLPQSPQQFKQLLMVAGIERYFQIARSFRDEDGRADRNPEFTQLDFEMSFVEQEDILALYERMMIALVQIVTPEKHITQTPFPRVTFKESMEKYGCDKPDMRKDKNDPDELAFCWVVDFPMFEKDSEGNVQAAHHPFCMPNKEDVARLESDPMNVRAQSFDLVLNGIELSSGSIRIHERELQNRIFALLGISPEDTQRRFGHMLEAFEYGAPPHGGCGVGIDRLVMILANESSVREIIAFPKTGDARDLMMGAPSTVDQKNLDEAHIKIQASSK